MPERRPSVAWIAAITALTLPLLYLGSYFALVTRSGQTERNTDNELMYVPAYRVGGTAAARLYFPVYMADRNLRGEYWTSEEAK